MSFPHTAKVMKDWRKSQNLTQKEVSEGIDLKTSQFVSNWERALCAVPMASLKPLKKKFPSFDGKAYAEAYVKDHAKIAEKQIRRFV
jgi:transcriptional regulator with XRE-family HTH domain